MPDSSHLKFYLTSLEPRLLNLTASQSVGGFPSMTPYSPSALLIEPMDFDTESVSLDDNFDQPYALSINEEIMLSKDVVDFDEEYSHTQIYTVERGFAGSRKRFHGVGDAVYANQRNGLFNSSLNKSGKQYRCIAVTNDSDSEIFYDLKFYFKSAGKNPNSKVRMAVEVPQDEIFYGMSTGGSAISLTDTSLIGEYDDDYFADRLLVIDDDESLNVGEGRVIASFDSRTGIFSFRNSMPYSIEADTTYRIEQTPAQRLFSGRELPNVNTSNVSDWSLAPNLTSALSINVGGNRIGGANLRPFETVYIWLERDISNNTDKFLNNSIVFSASYRDS